MLTEANNTPDPLYYRENFHVLAAFVTRSYNTILDEAEKQWYAKISSATIPAQCLYIRLLTRRGSTFRVSKLKYPEIGCAKQAIKELEALQLISTQVPDNILSLGTLFTVPELRSVAHSKDDVKNLPRAELLAYLDSVEPDIQRDYMDQLKHSDSFVTILGHAHWTLLQLCFFGNLYQDSSEFVLRELGTFRYENYDISPSARAFTSRDQLQAHLHYFECDALSATIDLKQSTSIRALLSNLPKPIDGDSVLRRRTDRLRNRLARQLERLGDTAGAVAEYELSLTPPARERRVRLHLSAGQINVALQLCEQMLELPGNEAEWQAAQKLHRQCLIACGDKPAARKNFKPDTSQLVLTNNGLRVELTVQAYYQRTGQCFYVENALFKGVLGLLIWDSVFAPVSGVFYNPFQIAPADFYESSFRKVRAQSIESQLGVLENKVQLLKVLREAFNRHHGKLNPLVHWARLSEELLQLAVRHIATAHWQAIFKRLLLDLKHNGNGLPDLIRFSDTGDYELIEVKGPGDQLQSNQRRWMAYFYEHNIPCRVVNVSWAGARASRPHIDSPMDAIFVDATPADAIPAVISGADGTPADSKSQIHTSDDSC